MLVDVSCCYLFACLGIACLGITYSYDIYISITTQMGLLM